MLDRFLETLARDPERSGVLDLSWDQLTFAEVGPARRMRLEERLREAGATTVREALGCAVDRRDAALLRELVEAAANEPDPAASTPQPVRVAAPADRRLADGLPQAELEAWAAEHLVSDLLALPAHALVPDLSPTDPARDVPAGVLLLEQEASGSWWWSGSWAPRTRRATAAALERLAEQTREGVAEEGRCTWRGEPPAHPALRTTWGRLVAAREELRTRTWPRGEHRRVALRLLDDPPALEAVLRGHRAVLPLGGDLPTIPREPGAALALVDRWLDALTAPEEARLRRELEGRLAVAPWERDLEALGRLSAVPDLDPEDDKPLVGWRVEEMDGALALSAVRLREKKGGDGFVARGESLTAIPEALLADPVDGAVHERLLGGDLPRETWLEALELLAGHPRVLPPGRGGSPIPVRRARFTVRVVHDDADGEPIARLVPALDEVPLAPADLSRALAAGNVAGGRIAVLHDDALLVGRVRRGFLDGLVAWLAREPRFPVAAHDRLLDAVGRLASRVAVGVDPALRGRRLPGDARPLLVLQWSAPEGEAPGLVVEARVRPLPELAPQVPGEGSSELFVRRGGRRCCVERDLDLEPSAVREALAALRLPERALQGPFTWRLTTASQALAVVERLQARLSSFQVEWRGEVPRVGPPLTPRNLRLRVSQEGGWLGARGEIVADGGAVDLDALSRTLEEGHDYVQVAAGTWARLDRALRLGLSALGSAELSVLQAPIVASLAEAGAEVELPVAWQGLMERLEEARTLQAVPPTGLQATLRDYQLVGFRWMAALAHWAPGAVLADDMGLGKTIQTITLLLHRQAEGPQLVVAPSSVIFNWERELNRFAPELRVRVHHGAGRGSLRGLGPGEVLLTTYGVLLRDAVELGDVRFATAVLDEAQAIKNPSTRRSAAAFGLDADFRLALSGTPVENRVTELWSLFRFVAPGLLGTMSSFERRFAGPIELRGDEERRELLNALIRPFVLRRTKEEVVHELPPLTEAVVRVVPSEEERTLYETARLRALQRLSGVATGDARPVRIFQELSMLRQLACHPRLVDPGCDVPSAKLRHVRRLVADLRAGGHRALIFSQFVRHLGLVREALAEDGVRIRYLDGSTALADRRREVDAFQSGDGDVFLISLEAGGVGLNLTAANYVVHLDPWWNPAKEDQATDRAHRIGQERPVTVYRLVTAGTIEERILELHARKRELAEALLVGTERAARTSAEELMELLVQAEDDGEPLDGDDTDELDDHGVDASA